MVTRSSGKLHSPLPPPPNPLSKDNNQDASPTQAFPNSMFSDEYNVAKDHYDGKVNNNVPRFGVLKGGKTYDANRRTPLKRNGNWLCRSRFFFAFTEVIIIIIVVVVVVWTYNLSRWD